MNPLVWTREEINIHEEYAKAKEKLNEARQVKRRSPQNLSIDEAVSHWYTRCKRLERRINESTSVNSTTNNRN
jgi:hypothetical protein